MVARVFGEGNSPQRAAGSGQSKVSEHRYAWHRITSALRLSCSPFCTVLLRLLVIKPKLPGCVTCFVYMQPKGRYCRVCETECGAPVKAVEASSCCDDL